MACRVISTICTGCGACVAICKHGAIALDTQLPNGYGRKTAVIDVERCVSCGQCEEHCCRRALLVK